MASFRVRADLVRVVEEEEEGDGVSIEEYYEQNSLKHLKGRVVREWPLVQVDSKSLDSPTCVRKQMLVYDLHAAQESHFYVTLFGDYAANMENLKICIGDTVLLEHPTIYPSRRSLPAYSDPETPHHKLGTLQVYMGHLTREGHVYVVRGQANSVSVNDCAVTQYTKISECRPDKKVHYNVWAVITSISRMPSMTNGRNMMAQVYIQDEACTGTYGYPDYQFSMLGSCPEVFPPLRVGSAIRIHHMVVQEWNGSLTGRVYDARSVLVVAFKQPLMPQTKAPTFTFTTQDVQRVGELKIWYDRTKSVDSQGLSQQFHTLLCDVTPTTSSSFDLYCKLLERHNDNKVLRITDGTKCPLSLVKHHHDGGGKSSGILLEEDTLECDLFLQNPIVIKDLDKSTYLYVRGVGLEVGKNRFKLVHNGVVEKLSASHSRAKEIEQRLSNPVRVENEQQQLLSDQTLMQLFDSAPMVTAYSANGDEMCFEEQENLSEEFFTCEVGNDESRVSPSPEPLLQYWLTTDTDFPWTTLTELEEGCGTDRHRIRGYIDDISFDDGGAILELCAYCCTAKQKYRQGRQKVCQQCKKEELKMVFNFVLTFSEEEKLQFAKKRQSKKIFLTGTYAEQLLGGVTPAEFLSGRQKTVHDVLIQLVDKPVEMSIIGAESTDGQMIYQVVNTFLHNSH